MIQTSSYITNISVLCLKEKRVYNTQGLNIKFLPSYMHHHIQDSMIKCKLLL